MDDKKVFIITPIGSNDSSIRRATDGLIDAVLIPVLTEHGFKVDNVLVSHRMSDVGSINKQIISNILDSDLAIANLTGLNANVMYELAIRHAARKPVIVICEDNTRLPFDIVDERTIFYTNDMLGAVQLKKDIEKMLPVCLNEENPDNPIYRVVESNIIKNVPGIDDVQKYILERLDTIEYSISRKIPKAPLFNDGQTTFSITGKLVNGYEPNDDDIFKMFAPKKAGLPKLTSVTSVIDENDKVYLSLTFSSFNIQSFSARRSYFVTRFVDKIKIITIEEIGNPEGFIVLTANI
ncbi:hypothetical protein C8Z91_06215 [Paenibacillus elgii]|uniref:Nucleoside 2-deoxyribosyltransferase n=1 Tax=Paenibacillus elgii TaxID=189691 RepID=A0A2T6G7F4_9BACL|nr:hypothetical protein [Paenibacillus elgii]PUA40088.1 hypothetical protein C8Z91_06215 [Paenibacillus elgii]